MYPYWTGDERWNGEDLDLGESLANACKYVGDVIVAGQKGGKSRNV